MTVGEAIRYTDTIRKNYFSARQKVAWLNQIEGRIQTEILGIDPGNLVLYETEQDRDTDLILRAPYYRIYPWYLMAMMDLLRGNGEGFANASAIVEAYVADFRRYYCLTGRFGGVVSEERRNFDETR